MPAKKRHHGVHANGAGVAHDSTMKPTNGKPATPRSSISIGILLSGLAAAVAVLLWYLLQLDSHLETSIRAFLTNNLVDAIDPLTQITYRGTLNSSVEHFQNIFYASDTSGQNRFAPPVPYTPARGSIVDSTRSGAWCPQGSGDVLPWTSVITNVSENCLSLRIARPSGMRRAAKLPVAVFIHGGGHALGSAADILYTPDGFVERSVRLGQPTVYVGINYRVGIFGFADGEALRARGHTNVGLRDQMAAIEWVRRNIAVFGGDSGRITVVGQSVGASDIGLHMVSKTNKRDRGFELPFRRAVLMNGGPGLVFNLDTSEVEERTAAVAKKVGCVGDGGTQSADVLQCLRDSPVEKLTEVSVGMMRAARPPFGEGFFQPYLDGDYISERPSEAIRRGDFATHIPIIAGWDHDEGAWYAALTTDSDLDVKASLTTWLTKLSFSTLKRLLKLYPTSDFEHLVELGSPVSAQYYRAARINRDLWFTCSVIDFTFHLAKRAGPQFARVYEMGSTRWTPALKMMGVPFWKISHLSGLPYVFNAGNMGGGVDNSPDQLQLSRYVSGQIIAWVNVVEAGIGVSPEGLPMVAWDPAYSKHSSDQWIDEFPAVLDVNAWEGTFGSGMATCSGSGGADERSKALRGQRLLERCGFINSPKVKRELGI